MDLRKSFSATLLLVLLAASPALGGALLADAPADRPQTRVRVAPSHLVAPPGEPVTFALAVENAEDDPLRLLTLDWRSDLYYLGDAPETLARHAGDLVDPPASVDVAEGAVTIDGVELASLRTLEAFAEFPHVWTIGSDRTCAFPQKPTAWAQTVDGAPAAPGVYLYTVMLRQKAGDEPLVGHAFFVVGGERAAAVAGQALRVDGVGCALDPKEPGLSALHASMQAYMTATRWATLPVDWWYNDAGRPGDLTFSAAETAIRNGIGAWENDAGKYYDQTYRGTTSTSALTHDDTVNVAGWTTDLGNPATAFCRSNPAGRYRLSCDVVFDSSTLWTTTPYVAGRKDLESVAAHEGGHVVGLDHVSDTVCGSVTIDKVFTMCSGWASEYSYRRTLEWGDRAGLRYMYPLLSTAVDPWATGSRPGVGAETAEMGAAAGNLDGGTLANDLVVVWADEVPGDNAIYYRVGLNAGTNSGRVSSWGPIRTGVSSADTGARTGVGTLTQGVGATVSQFDFDSRPDLLIAWIDDPDGDNRIYYKFLLNLDSTGIPASSTTIMRAAPSATVGSQSVGLGVCTGDINADGNRDAIFAWMDNPAGDNEVYWAVGYWMWYGGPQSWSARVERYAPYWDGDTTAGFDIACADFDGGGLDMVTGWIDNPVGENHVYMRIGRNMFSDGIANWAPAFDQSAKWGPGEHPEWWGAENQGLGMTAYNANNLQGNEILYAWVDNPYGENYIHYRTEWDGQYHGHEPYTTP